MMKISRLDNNTLKFSINSFHFDVLFDLITKQNNLKLNNLQIPPTGVPPTTAETLSNNFIQIF